MALLSTENYQKCLISVEDIRSHSRRSTQHDSRDQISGIHVFQGSADTLVSGGGITNHHSIAYSLNSVLPKITKLGCCALKPSVQCQCRFLRHSWNTMVCGLSILTSRPGQLSLLPSVGREKSTYWSKGGDALWLGVRQVWVIPLVDVGEFHINWRHRRLISWVVCYGILGIIGLGLWLDFGWMSPVAMIFKYVRVWVGGR